LPLHDFTFAADLLPLHDREVMVSIAPDASALCSQNKTRRS